MAIWPLFPGFVYQFNKSYKVATGWQNLYKLGWLFAVFMGATTYVVLSFIFRNPAMVEARKHPWESYAELQKDVLDKEIGDTIIEGSTPEVGSDTSSEIMHKGFTEHVKPTKEV